MGLPRQECWSGLPFPSLGDLSDPGFKHPCPALHVDSLPLSHQGSPNNLTAVWCTVVSHFSHVQLFATHEPQPARLLYPRNFPGKNKWSGLPCPPPRDLPDSEIEPASLVLQEGSLSVKPSGKTHNLNVTG